MNLHLLRLLRLLHLSSPALPIGGFHFSQGLEYAVEAGWVRDEATAREWIAGLAGSAVGTLDLPVLSRLQDAWMRHDCSALQHWNAWLLAARETAELRAEDRHMGSALRKVLIELGMSDLLSAMNLQHPCYAAMFALACFEWDIAKAETLQSYAWVWTENQVLAAVKLVPLGQSAGQRILHSLIPPLADISAHALTMQDDDIGIGTVMQGLASARHELQYTRLFRS